MKKRNRNLIVLTLLASIVILWVELLFLGHERVPFLAKVLLFVLFNLNLMGLLALIFFVGRGIVNIYLERKRRVLGHRFKTQLVVILVVLTLIPSVFLFVVSSGVVTNYIDRWFDPQIKQPLALSVEIAQEAYEMQKKQMLAYGDAVVSGRTVPGNVSITSLSAIPENASETVRAGFEGKADAEVVSAGDGDIVRAVVPRYEGGRVSGVVLVESRIGREISTNAEAIRRAYQDYLTIESWKLPIKTNYLLILSFFTLSIVFLALWVGMRISQGITGPIQSLAQATERVARGDLDMEVTVSRDDEIGLLVDSFNRMVKELRESKESLQGAYAEGDRRRILIENIIENINSGVISLDTSGSIITMNSAACSILDVTLDAVIGKNYAALLSFLKSEELIDTVRQVRLRDFKGVEREVRVKRGNQIILLRVFIAPLGGPDNFLGTLVVFDDLTEIARAQKALAWQEVARRIAHEIKNPLTPIKLSTDHMVKKWQSGDNDFGKVFERSTKTIMREVESLKRLVDEFSRFGKMPEIQKTPVLISSIIEGVATLYRDYREIEIGTTVQDPEVPVDADAEQFKRVIINIVDNAIQAMQSRGRIDIAVRQDVKANRVWVDIADSGPGIRDEDKEKLFLPYFSTKKDGTGLGLAIASRVITEHRGYIRVSDNAGSGTVFSIELPIKEG